MKKRGLRAVACFLFLSLIFTGCGRKSTQKDIVKKPSLELDFSLDYPTDEASLDTFLEADSFLLIADAGPYYVGQENSTLEIMQEFERLKKAKVAEAIGLTDEILVEAKKVKAMLDEFKDDFAYFYGQVASVEEKFEKEKNEVTEILLTDKLTADYLLINAEAIEEVADNAAVNANMQYKRSMLALELAEVLNRDIATFTSLSAQFSLAFENDERADVNQGFKYFESKMGKMSILSKNFSEMNDRVETLIIAIKQINTGEYYMGLASLDFIKQNKADIETKIASIAPSDDVSAEDIEFIGELAQSYFDFADIYTEVINYTDEDFLISEEVLAQLDYDPDFRFINEAQALDSKYWKWAVQGLAKGAKAVKDKVSSTVGETNVWKTIKQTYNDATEGAGIMIGATNAAVKSGMDVAMGKWYGNSNQEIKKTVQSNWRKLYENDKAGKAGSEVWKNAENYFDDAENAVGDTAEAGVEAVMGKGWTSWAAGHLGRITTNMFTGLGKGITKIANQESTQGEVAEGLLDVSLSFIGGSKVLVKGSQAVKGARYSFNLTAQKGVNYLGQMLTKMDARKFKLLSKEILKNKKLSKGMVKELIENSAKINFNNSLRASMKQVSKNINQEFKALFNNSLKALGRNVDDGGRAFMEFTGKSFTNSLTGYKEAFKTVVGSSLKEYADNIFGSKMDDLLKYIVKNTIDAGINKANAGEVEEEWDDESWGDMWDVKIDDYELDKIMETLEDMAEDEMEEDGEEESEENKTEDENMETDTLDGEETKAKNTYTVNIKPFQGNYHTKSMLELWTVEVPDYERLPLHYYTCNWEFYMNEKKIGERNTCSDTFSFENERCGGIARGVVTVSFFETKITFDEDGKAVYNEELYATETAERTLEILDVEVYSDIECVDGRAVPK